MNRSSTSLLVLLGLVGCEGQLTNPLARLPAIPGMLAGNDAGIEEEEPVSFVPACNGRSVPTW